MKCLAVILVGIIFWLGCISAPSPTPKVCFGERCVLVEVADSPDERSRGLMFRGALTGNYGMLFIFDEESVHGFWMKNTMIPLDAVWMDSQGKIVDIQTMLPCEKDPCPVFSPAGNAKLVLEVNAGLMKSWNVRRGDWAHVSGV